MSLVINTTINNLGTLLNSAIVVSTLMGAIDYLANLQERIYMASIWSDIWCAPLVSFVTCTHVTRCTRPCVWHPRVVKARHVYQILIHIRCRNTNQDHDRNLNMSYHTCHNRIVSLLHVNCKMMTSQVSTSSPWGLEVCLGYDTFNILNLLTGDFYLE